MNWGGGMGFDLGDADFGAAPVAVLKNDLFDEISSQEGGNPWDGVGFKVVTKSTHIA